MIETTTKSNDSREQRQQRANKPLDEATENNQTLDEHNRLMGWVAEILQLCSDTTLLDTKKKKVYFSYINCVQCYVCIKRKILNWKRN